MNKDENYVEFPIPDGLDLAGMEDDTDKEVVAVIRKKDDGTACLISVDGVDVTPSQEPEGPAEVPSSVKDEPTAGDAYAGYAARARQSLA